MINFKQLINYLIIFPFLIANSSIKTAIAGETDIPQQELMVWRIDPKPGSIYSTYILGSYHVGKECQINSPAFEHAFKDAETVVFEIDSLHDEKLLVRQSQQYMSQLITQKGVPANAQQSLQGMLEPATYEQLATTAAAMDFPLDNFARLKPWVFMFVFTSAQLAQTEYKPECGIDPMVAKLSQSEQKTIQGLETLDYQLDKVSDLYIAMDSTEMKQSLVEIAEMESGDEDELSSYLEGELDSVISAASGNIEALESYINEWCSEEPEQCESLLHTRNRNWIPKIEKLLQQKQDSLVVVGAGHLVGETSVIQLLKQRGYRVRRFYNTFRLADEQ